MNKYFVKFICAFIPSKKLRKQIRMKYIGSNLNKESKIVKKYLFGLNGIEIGGSSNNDFYLDRYGAYCNVNFAVGAWKDYNNSQKIVNIVANGDDLPFKDNTLDYVFTSHVMEHVFDPIATIEEHLRVIKTRGGVLLMIIPHKQRTYDNDREITPVQELLDRHDGKLKIDNYCYALDGKGHRKNIPPMKGDTHILPKDNKIPEGYTKFLEDDHHHWSVWTTKSFLDLCKMMNWNVIDYYDVDDRHKNSFIVIIKK